MWSFVFFNTIHLPPHKAEWGEWEQSAVGLWLRWLSSHCPLSDGLQPPLWHVPWAYSIPHQRHWPWKVGVVRIWESPPRCFQKCVFNTNVCSDYQCTKFATFQKSPFPLCVPFFLAFDECGKLRMPWKNKEAKWKTSTMCTGMKSEGTGLRSAFTSWM